MAEAPREEQQQLQLPMEAPTVFLYPLKNKYS
jgi:hypothetical protein